MTSKLTRRAALGAIATVPAAAALPAVAATENPRQRIDRLASELSNALDEWFDGEFMAEIYPSKTRTYAIGYTAVDRLEKARFGVSKALTDAIETHKAAHVEHEDSCNPADRLWCEKKGLRHTKAAVRRNRRASRAEFKTLGDLCRLPTRNAAEQRAKARYLIDYGNRAQLDNNEFDALLESMLNA